MKKMFRQSQRLGAGWGNFKLITQHTSSYIQMFILAFSGTAAYGVIAEQIHKWGYTFPFYQFVLAVVIILFVIGVAEWTLSLPSTFTSWNWQWWQHKNPFRKEFNEFREEVNEKLDRLLNDK